MIQKMLVANRGEIAVRIIRTCREMGIQTVAIYSEADKEALHVQLADEAICIGPSSSLESYINATRVLSAARISNVDAIHPGYGFLSEDTAFAKACLDEGFEFIGPSPETMEKMGAKAAARETMKEAGVPIVPGTDGIIHTVQEATATADTIGYPVIVKATAGGGGKGMRMAHDSSDLEKAFRQAQSEAKLAFGNADVYIEKFVVEPRHIEFQILADKKGSVVHLGERDCSIQRRHQKLIEEAPSSAIDPSLREKMGEVAVKAAKAVDYVGAGTVEFLLDADDRFYFMEMNTRIQVEHPVTEMVVKKDLIKEQIKIANGSPLSFTQQDVQIEGHSIECRINAENPFKEFTPAPGKVEHFNVPNGFGVRTDTAVYPGYKIPPYYDSMVAKLIVWGQTREEARRRMKRALYELDVQGIETTIPFHHWLLDNDAFKEGSYNTSFLENNNFNDKASKD